MPVGKVWGGEQNNNLREPVESVFLAPPPTDLGHRIGRVWARVAALLGCSVLLSVCKAGLSWASVADRWQLVPSAYTAEATLQLTLAFCNVNCSRLKPLRSWMRDGSAEVFCLIKGTDRFPKPRNQRLSVHTWSYFFQPPLAMSHILSILVESQS